MPPLPSRKGSCPSILAQDTSEMAILSLIIPSTRPRLTPVRPLWPAVQPMTEAARSRVFQSRT